MSFIHDDFLLHTKTAQRLYHQFAEDQPILDYHCHLPPQDVAANRRFRNLFEIWLEGDHYKWRAMRANGVGEEYRHRQRAALRKIPGLGPNRALHAAQSAVSLDAPGAEALFRDRRTARTSPARRASGSAPTSCWPARICAPTASCASSRCGPSAPPTIPPTTWRATKAIAASGLATKVFPAFRPTKLSTSTCPSCSIRGWRGWRRRPASSIGKFADFVDALKKRHEFFHQMGGRLSDHGLNHVFGEFATERKRPPFSTRPAAARRPHPTSTPASPVS